ncbi:MAG: CRISPR-associated protein Cse2 family [Chthonomonadales bacterium]|nr:CRISPR-associated protein Cse2 family [Chthonomonadales bacterium]
MSIQEEYAADYTLMRHLLRLHADHDKKHDVEARGKLANLRYAMRDRLHADYPVGRVFPALHAGGLTDDPERNEWRTLVAGLFGYAHDDVEDSRGVTLGTALRALYERRENDSLERRFMALLNADAEHLPGYLRQSISLLKAESIGLDWGMLLNHVCDWNAAGKPVQKKWISDYYRSRRDTDAAPSSADSTTEEDNLSDQPIA